MEKIKASEVFAIIKKNYRFFCRDTDGSVSISTGIPEPDIDSDNIMWLSSELDDSNYSIPTIDIQSPISKGECLSSLREIDFSEDFTEEKLELIDDLVRHLTERFSYENSRQFFYAIEEFRGMVGSVNKIGVGRPVFIDSDGNVHESVAKSSIFQQGDTVHVLSYSNQGEFGVSTQGVVKAIKSNSFIAVEIVNGIEEIHQEKNISFTPFSIHEAGFSQIRPEREINVGDWGFFYNKKPAKSFCYHKLYSMGNLKKVRMGVDYPFTTDGGTFYKYFSHTPPQLADGIPNPFKEC